MNFLLIILSKEMEIHPKTKYKDIQKSNHQQNFPKIFNSKIADTIRDQQQKNINLKKKRKENVTFIQKSYIQLLKITLLENL